MPSILEMHGIGKRFPGVVALEDVQLQVSTGEIVALAGENGAGKSTLIKTMAGVVVPDEGRMLLDGREVSFADPAAANAAGIVCVFQELSLIPELSVADNIVVSHPPTRFGMVRDNRRVASEGLTTRYASPAPFSSWSAILSRASA